MLPAGARGAEARALVADLLPSTPWAWKDPRLCLTLPFWLEVLDARPAMVVCLRNPLEIAASLAERNGFALRHLAGGRRRLVVPAGTATRKELTDETRSENGNLHTGIAQLGE